MRPGGYAAIILPSSILDKGTNSSFIAARDVLLRSFELVAIARFGSGTFAATGTNVAILFLRRFDEVPTRDDCAQVFVDAVFSVLGAAGEPTMGGIKANWRATVPKMLAAAALLDPARRKVVTTALSNVIRTLVPSRASLDLSALLPTSLHPTALLPAAKRKLKEGMG